MSTPYPKRVDRFKEWSKLMCEQATVPDRVQYKQSGSGETPRLVSRRGRKRRRKRTFRRKRRAMKGD